MEVCIREAKEKISNCSDAEIRDGCLLSCIQAINHFKISTYPAAAFFANVLGFKRQAALYHEAELNEKLIANHLTQLAEFEITAKAKMPILFTG